MTSGYAIATLVVFIVSIFFVIHPVKIPTPRPLPRIPLNLTTAPILAIALLWAAQCIDPAVIRNGIVGTEGTKPYNILILFFSLAYMAITLDITGILQAAAFWVGNMGGHNGWKLYLYFYIMLTLLSILLGNDPAIFSGTAFLVYYTEVAQLSPWAWVMAQFAAVNTASMVLFVGSPTNVVICEGFGVNEAAFTAYTILPFVACTICCFVALAVQYRHQVPRKIGYIRWDPRSALQDPVGAWVGSVMLGATLVLCFLVVFFGIDVWMISLPFAVGKLLFGLTWDYYRYTHGIPILGRSPCDAGREGRYGVCADGKQRIPTSLLDDGTTIASRPYTPQFKFQRAPGVGPEVGHGGSLAEGQQTAADGSTSLHSPSIHANTTSPQRQIESVIKSLLDTLQVKSELPMQSKSGGERLDEGSSVEKRHPTVSCAVRHSLTTDSREAASHLEPTLESHSNILQNEFKTEPQPVGHVETEAGEKSPDEGSSAGRQQHEEGCTSRRSSSTDSKETTSLRLHIEVALPHAIQLESKTESQVLGRMEPEAGGENNERSLEKLPRADGCTSRRSSSTDSKETTSLELHIETAIVSHPDSQKIESKMDLRTLGAVEHVEKRETPNECTASEKSHQESSHLHHSPPSISLSPSLPFGEGNIDGLGQVEPNIEPQILGRVLPKAEGEWPREGSAAENRRQTDNNSRYTSPTDVIRSPVHPFDEETAVGSRAETPQIEIKREANTKMAYVFGRHRSYMGDLYYRLDARFPTLMTALPRLPFILVPFAFSQFILIEALDHQGWVDVFAKWLVRASHSQIHPTIWLVGITGVILCNLSGTNIGATILLTKVVRAAAFPYETNRAAAIALAVASNVGAVSFTFSASLPGLLWRAILRQEGVWVKQRDFALWNLFPLLIMTSVGLGVVSVEMAVLFQS